MVTIVRNLGSGTHELCLSGRDPSLRVLPKLLPGHLHSRSHRTLLGADASEIRSNFSQRSSRLAVRAASSEPRAELSSDDGVMEKTEYENSLIDDIFLAAFRRKLVKETSWASRKPGYDGMIEEAKRLLSMFQDRADAEAAAVRILLSFFPPGLLPMFKRVIAPAFDGRLGAILSAQVTLVTCQWLMGPSKASDVELADGTTLRSGVKIEKCRFLEETKCAGSCIHTCKMPTQAFMQEHMGVPLFMEPNYKDFSCEFKFGVAAPERNSDPLLLEPCLAVCPAAMNRSQLPEGVACPEVIK